MAELVAEIRRLQPDAVVSLGFTRRIRSEILDLLPGRCVNLHPALLPAYRGPSPTWAMIMDGRLSADGGATLHVVDEGFDTGPIIAAQPAPPDAWRNPIRYALAVAHDVAALLAEDLPRYLAGELKAMPQDQARASHRRVDRSNLMIRPDMDRQTVARIVDAIPWTARLKVQVGERHLTVDSLLLQGPRSSANTAKVTWRW